MTLYELKHIRHAYDGHPVLSIDHWQVVSDAVTGIVGPNGSGKSTLLTLLGFVAPPTNGEIRFNGVPAHPFADAVRGKVALLPQEAFLLKRSVYGNIAYGLRMNAVEIDERRRVNTAMEMVGLDPADFSRRPWYALSGGEARRVALAARLALKPQVLLMDEPTTSVDAASAQLIKEAALHARKQWGTALIVSSHDAEWLADISDCIVHLFRGRIMGNGQQSLIFGPWQRADDGLAVKLLSADQTFAARNAPADLSAAVAAVQAGHLKVHLLPQKVTDNRRQLKGLLLRLSFEQSAGRISASVLVGRNILTAYVSEKDQEGCNFVPGQTVWIEYDPGQVAWY